MIDRRTMIGMALAVSPAAACSRPAKATAIDVYNSPSCGCCGAWVSNLRTSGLSVVVHDMDDVTPVATKAGVPADLRSCHTAIVEGYFVEGHVPATDIRRLLRDRPNARGIAVPGMPFGSPGMEQGDLREPYETLLVDRQAKVTVFARHNQQS